MKTAIAQIKHSLLIIQRETGRLVDPPDFEKCYEAIDDIENEINTIYQDLLELEEAER